MDVVARRVGELGDAGLSLSRIRGGWEVMWPTKGGDLKAEVTAVKDVVLVRCTDEDGAVLGEASFVWPVPEAVARFVIEALR